MSTLFSNAATIAIQVGILFVIICVGFVISRLRVVTRGGIRQIVDILLYIVTPCLIVNSFLSVDNNPETTTELLIAAGCALLTHAVAIAVSFVFIKVKCEPKKAVYRFATIFSNGGFMSLPLAQALFGEKGVFLVSMYVIVFNIITWTFGLTLFKSKKQSRLHALLNPGNVGVVIGLPLFLLSVQLPEIIGTPISSLASMNTPLAMLVTGFYLSQTKLRDGLRDGGMWLTVALRLIAVPVIMLLIFRFVLGMSGVLLCCCLVPACAPSAVNTIMFSAKFGGDAQTASRLISITTALSIITMPVLLALAQA